VSASIRTGDKSPQWASRSGATIDPMHGPWVTHFNRSVARRLRRPRLCSPVRRCSVARGIVSDAIDLEFEADPRAVLEWTSGVRCVELGRQLDDADAA
jgi:hypothetical protein